MGFIGKFAKCKKKNVKNACHALHELTTSEGKDDLFSTYTKSPTGCPCWFDMTRSDCACCEDAGVQCGAPMQNYCTKKEPGRQKGCLGVPANHWTLSTTGYPCYFNTSRTDCAWCASGGAQCGNRGDKGPDSPGGSRCWDPDDPGYCDSVPGDACTFRNVIVKQNVSLMSNLGLTESTTLVGVSLDGREMGSNAMIRKVFQVQKHYRLEMFPLQWQSVATIMCIHITLPNFLLDQARQILSTISQRCLTLEQPVPANQIVKVLSSISKNPLNRRSST